MNVLIRLLVWIGLVKIRHDGTVRWPFSFPPSWVWKEMWSDLLQGTNPLLTLRALSGYWLPYRFRNLPGVIKWVPGRLLPRRWGFGWLGFEFGDRGS